MDVSDEILIKVYDEFGHKYFAKGSDEELKEWGNSDEKIREIKVHSVRCLLDFNKDGIKAYELINRFKGGEESMSPNQLVHEIMEEFERAKNFGIKEMNWIPFKQACQRFYVKGINGQTK